MDASREQFARQTRRPIFSQAVRPRPSVPSPLRVNVISQRSATKTYRKVRSGSRRESPAGSGTLRAVSHKRSRNVSNQQSRMEWASLHIDIADDRGLGTTPNAARRGSQRQRSDSNGRTGRRCEEGATSSRRSRTLPRDGRRHVRSTNPGQRSRVSEG